MRSCSFCSCTNICSAIARNASLMSSCCAVRRQNSRANSSACRQTAPLTSLLKRISTASRRRLPLLAGAKAIGNISYKGANMTGRWVIRKNDRLPWCISLLAINRPKAQYRAIRW